MKNFAPRLRRKAVRRDPHGLGLVSDMATRPYALLAPGWFDASGLSPSKFNRAQLEADLRTITAL
jgi:hypothetical protein